MVRIAAFPCYECDVQAGEVPSAEEIVPRWHHQCLNKAIIEETTLIGPAMLTLPLDLVVRLNYLSEVINS